MEFSLARSCPHGYFQCLILMRVCSLLIHLQPLKLRKSLKQLLQLFLHPSTYLSSSPHTSLYSRVSATGPEYSSSPSSQRRETSSQSNLKFQRTSQWLYSRG